VRASHCTRSRIQIMVGTSSTSVTTQVMAASSRVISIALSRGGTPIPWNEAICRQADSDHVPSLAPSSENRAIASSGRTKNSPNTVKTR